MRGQVSKDLIAKVILSIFPNSFVDGKDIRIPASENGEEVQIKVALTASKTNLEHENGIVKQTAIPAEMSDIIPVGPLTDEQKEQLVSALMGVIDVDLEPIVNISQE